MSCFIISLYIQQKWSNVEIYKNLQKLFQNYQYFAKACFYYLEQYLTVHNLHNKHNQTPIVLVHGILSNADAMKPVYNQLKQMYPNRYIVQMEIGNGKFDSIFMNFDKQVEYLYSNILKDQHLQNGINLLCHSQGSHICLTTAVRYGKSLKINKMILEAGAFMGQNCLDNTNISEYKCFIKNQQKISNFLEKIPNSSKYISYMQVWDTDNNKQNQCLKKLQPQQDYKNNLLSLKQIIFVASRDDGVITPYQSSHFGYYKDFNNKDYTIVPLQQQQLYIEDWIGLKQLDQDKKLKFVTLTNIKHTDYNSEQSQKYLSQQIYYYFNEDQ